MVKSTVKVVLLFLAFTLTFGGTAYPQAAGTPGDKEVKERIDFIQKGFEDGQFRSKLWSYSWIGIYSGFTGYFTYAAIADDSEKRASNIVSASKSAIAVTMLLAQPFKACYAAGAIRVLPEGTPEERMKKLESAESWLKSSSKQQKGGRSLKKHLISLAVHLVGGGFVWYFESLENALISVGSGIITSGLNIWTQPMHSVRQYRDYGERYKPLRADAQEDQYYYWALFPGGFVAGTRF